VFKLPREGYGFVSVRGFRSVTKQAVSSERENGESAQTRCRWTDVTYVTVIV